MVVPSPKSNAYDSVWPCGSVEADASAVTCTGAVPDVGVTVRPAVGAFGAAATEPSGRPESVSPAVFVTVTVTGKEPAAV